MLFNIHMHTYTLYVDEQSTTFMTYKFKNSIPCRNMRTICKYILFTIELNYNFITYYMYLKIYYRILQTYKHQARRNNFSICLRKQCDRSGKFISFYMVHWCKVVWSVGCQRDTRRCSTIYLFNNPRLQLVSYNSNSFFASRLQLDYSHFAVKNRLSLVLLLKLECFFDPLPCTLSNIRRKDRRNIDGSLRFGDILCIDGTVGRFRCRIVPLLQCRFRPLLDML